MMNTGAKLDSIPMDLFPEILARLPAKSIARFCCVSKLWKSIICRQDFTDLFNTISLSKPRLLIAFRQGCGEWSFFSSPQPPKNHYGKSSLIVTADFHTKFSKDSSLVCGYLRRPYFFSYASGLFYFPNMQISKEYEANELLVRRSPITELYISKECKDEVRAICNPITGQYAILPPDPRTNCRDRSGLLGFDPISKQFKVLVLKFRECNESVYQILTLGTEKLRWREIRCPSLYGPHCSGICINGVLYYYIAFDLIGYFDVRSEKFKFLKVDHVDSDVGKCFRNLINYKGKLCGSKLEYGHDGGFPLKLRMMVLEDVEKGEWTTYAYTLSADVKVVNYDLWVIGVTASGEIVLAKKKVTYYKPFYVFYFNPETNTLLSVEIKGAKEEEEYCCVYCFVDHVEDLNFDVMKTTYAATSIRPPEQRTTNNV